MNDNLLERLSNANPVVEVKTSEADLAELLTTVLGSTPPSASVRRRSPSAFARRRPAGRARRGAVAAAVIFALGLASAGAATHWLGARTGEDSVTVEGGAYGEILRMNGSDVSQIIDVLGKDIPLPPGGSFSAFKARLARDEASRQSELGLRSALEFVATCQWTGWWLKAYAAGDAARMMQARRVLADIPNWPGTKAATDLRDKPTAAIVATAALTGSVAIPRRIYRVNCAPADR